jgi:hypothetical protein
MADDGMKLADPDVIGEVIDGEAVLINLATGCYYSVRGAGAQLLQQLLDGVSLEAVRSAHAATIAEVDRFIDELVSEAILQPTPASSASGATTVEGDLVLERFTDMQELLLLDPIHDVSSAGWPNLPSN